MPVFAGAEDVSDVRGRAVDVDNHYYEPDDCYLRYIEPAFRELAFQARGPVGQRVWTMGEKKASFTAPGLLPDFMLAPGALQGLFSGTDVDASQVVITAESIKQLNTVPEWNDRDARLELMDAQGLRTIWQLPTNALLLYYDFLDRPAAVNANIRSFNRWMDAEWGFARADGRVISVPMLTLLDVDWAIEELEYVVGRGARSIWIPHVPVDGRSHAHPSFDRFWERVQALGVKLVYHIGFEGFTHLYGTLWGENPHKSVNEYSSFQHYLCFGERPISDAVAALVLHNLFGRFPGIELVTIENGSDWVAPLMRAMDKAVKLGKFNDTLGGTLPDRPSDILRNHLYVNPFHEDDVVGLLECVGADRVLFGSDYPHPEGIAEPLSYADKLLGKVSAEDFRKIMYENAAALSNR